MRDFHLSPYARSTVGFDHLFNMLERTADASNAYPPYDIERSDENHYRITLAVAGFREKDLTVETRDGVLTVSGQAEGSVSDSIDPMMAVPIWFPADPTIDEPEIPAEDRTVAFAGERRYLLREASDSTDGVLSPVIHGALVAAVALWAAAFVAAVRALARGDGAGADEDARPDAPTSEPAAAPA